jgi:site-specific recombinase XerD
MENTASLLERYIDRPGAEARNGGPLFCNRSRRKLTRAGICHILQKHVRVAKEVHAGLFLDKVTPHVVRHSKAVHMLQVGVPLIYIRDFLGHVQISTTEVYARCDSSAVREALASSNGIAIDAEEPRWQRDSSLMSWLSSL